MREIYFDGIVGPTHHFGGHSPGNRASISHAGMPSNPKGAALQGLEKMKRVMELGGVQAVLPPHDRPSYSHLQALGFHTPEEVPDDLFFAVSSASPMWRANSALATPSCDSSDGRVHLSVANLLTHFHRSLESEETFSLFKQIFSNSEHFVLHPPLFFGGNFGDEGAANHLRVKGHHLFFYGHSIFEPSFFSRQALEASQAIARNHLLDTQKTHFVRQNPDLIEKGVFHSDLIAFAAGEHFFYHEKAFQDLDLPGYKVTEEVLPLKKALATYFFNSQLLKLPGDEYVLLAPRECQTLSLDWLPMPIEYVDLDESMRNGGGPACLRLPLLLTDEEIQALPQSLFLTPPLYNALKSWIEAHYRDHIVLSDLKDPHLLFEAHEALDELTEILALGSIYPFQKN